MKYKTITAAALLLFALLLTACGAERAPELQVLPDWDNNRIDITAQKAGVGSMVSGASVTLAEGEALVIDTALTDASALRIKLFLSTAPDDPDASVDEILHADDTPALELVLSGTGSTEYPLAPGEYSLMLSVETKSTGTASIYTR